MSGEPTPDVGVAAAEPVAALYRNKYAHVWDVLNVTMEDAEKARKLGKRLTGVRTSESGVREYRYADE